MPLPDLCGDPAAMVAVWPAAPPRYDSEIARPHVSAVDVSHRGGTPGFVKVDKSGVLTVPDYRGNNFFSTLGNIYLNNRAGLTFISWKKKTLLQMTGFAEVYTVDGSILSKAAQRLWNFRPETVICRSLLLNYLKEQ